MGSKLRLTVSITLALAFLGAAAPLAAAVTRAPLAKPPATRITEPRAYSSPRLHVSSGPGVTGFPGLGACDPIPDGLSCSTPGEPVIAVGPSDVLETANTAAAVYDKSIGAKLAEFDFPTFWDGSGTDSCFDPRALYLASVDRFAIACTDNTTPTSPMRFAISQTSDPTGAWYKYAAPNASFLDQEKIEATSDKFIIAGNTSNGEPMYVYNLSDVVAGVANPKVVLVTAKKSNVYEAAVQQTATSNGYFVSSFPGNQLYLATVTGTPASNNVAVKETKISASDFPAPQAPQDGDIVVRKTRVGPFTTTDLHEQVQAKGIETLIVAEGDPGSFSTSSIGRV
jgi:hypothetical protein